MSVLDETLRRHRRRLIEREEQAVRELLVAYAQIEDELRASIRELERKVRDAREAGTEISPSWLQRQGRLRSLLDQVKQQIERFGGRAAAITAREQRAAITIAADQAAETVALILPGRGLSVATIFNPRTVEDAVGMMGDGSPILEYYRQQLAPRVAEMIRVEVIKAAAAGTDFRTIANRLMQTGQITRQRALTVARTEVGRVRRETTRAVYEENGFLEWEWVAAKSPRTCVVCLALDGRRFPLKTPFPQHINCRCTMIAVIPGVERPPRTLGKDWFERQPDDVKEKILGKAAAEAYGRGEVTLDDFVGWATSKEFGKRVYTKKLSDIMNKGDAHVLYEATLDGVQGHVEDSLRKANYEVSTVRAKTTNSRYVFAKREGEEFYAKIRISDHAAGASREHELGLDLRADARITADEIVKAADEQVRKLSRTALAEKASFLRSASIKQQIDGVRAEIQSITDLSRAFLPGDTAERQEARRKLYDDRKAELPELRSRLKELEELLNLAK